MNVQNSPKPPVFRAYFVNPFNPQKSIIFLWTDKLRIGKFLPIGDLSRPPGAILFSSDIHQTPGFGFASFLVIRFVSFFIGEMAVSAKRLVLGHRKHDEKGCADGDPWWSLLAFWQRSLGWKYPNPFPDLRIIER